MSSTSQTRTPVSLPSSSTPYYPSTSSDRETPEYNRSSIGTTGYSSSGRHASTRRHRPRQSGGFLLASNGPRNLEDRQSATDTIRENTVKKSQNRSKLPVAISRISPDSGDTRSAGRSPLSKEVVREGSAESLGKYRQSELRESTNGLAHPISHGARKSMTASSLESDPAQIVGLALNLSENRRRHFSTGRPLPIDAPSARRVSSPQILSRSTSIPTASGLKQHLGQQRKASQTYSPRIERPTSHDIFFTHPDSAAIADGLRNQIIPGVELDSLIDPTFDPSEATLIRAERAKVALELRFEHRRLLRHLPALPLCIQCRPVTSKDHEADNKSFRERIGRAYNPLQYIRNRKVRVRERQTLDSEGDGWKDLNGVREWIDQVATEQRSHDLETDDQSPLPVFSGRSDVGGKFQAGSMVRDDGIHVPQIRKNIRPKTDWVTSPWDFLSDHYWLSKGGNRFLVEDRHRHKIYGFTRTDPTKPYSKRSASATRVVDPTDKKSPVKNARQNEFHAERGRPRHERHESVQSQINNSSSQERKTRWRRKLIRSYSSSSSDETDDEILARRKGQDIRTFREIRFLDRQILALIDQDAENWNWKDLNDFDEGDSSDIRPRVTKVMDASRPDIVEQADRAIPSLRRRKLLSGRSYSKRNSLLHKSGSSREALDDTSPDFLYSSLDKSPINTYQNSPDKHVPKSASTSRKRIMEQVDDTDFASDTPLSSAGFHNSRGESTEHSRPYLENEMLSSYILEGREKMKKTRLKARPSKMAKVQKEPESRLKGLLKSAKLSDIVASPVNKVGEYIWRKDMSESADDDVLSSASSSYATENETEDSNLVTQLSRSGSELSQRSSAQKPQYHMENLPVFKSPFAKGDYESSNKTDHISRQQRAIREARSQRFDKLAPPALDMRSISPSPSRSPERGIDADRIVSNQSGQASAGADRRRFAVVEGSPDPQGKRHPVTGNAEDTARRSILDESGNLVLDLRSSKGVSKADIARVSALTLSTHNKAAGIIRQATEAKDPPHPILQTLKDPSGETLGPISRAQENVIIGGLLIKEIDDTHSALRSAAETFANQTMSGLHEQLHALDDLITSQLTGMVRKAADDSDELGTQLTTELAMEVKRLNENIDLVLRRRRRRLRWIRRGGYTVLEWLLLALMWWAWLVVVVIRILRGSIRATWRGLRWLLWLS